MITNNDIVNEARKWIDIPFKHQGRTTLGIDCAGLIVKVAHGLNISKFDYTAYRREPDGRTLEKILKQNLDRKLISDLDTGDIILFKLLKMPQHLAIKTDMGIIHAHMPVGKVTETILDATWKSKIVGVFSYRGINK